MNKYLEVRAKTGENSEGKAFYKTIGRVIETQKGQMLKLDVVPLGWDGWAYLNEPMEKGDAPAGRPVNASRAAARRVMEDDPPF